MDRFLSAQKAFDCATAFAYLTPDMRAKDGSPANLCALLHKDLVVSFMPSTLIHQGASSALVQVQVFCGDGSSDFYIATVIPTPGQVTMEESSALDRAECVNQ